MKINESMFREYDIRGIYNEDLNGEVAYLIGKAFGTKCKRLGISNTVIAHDNRLSSPILNQELIKGVLETGTNVISIGLATSPMCYYAAKYFKTGCYLMITASHNPKEYNGFKFSYSGNHNEYGEKVHELYELIVNNDFESGNGVLTNESVRDAYIHLVIDKLDFGDKKIKVVYDCGNGTSSIIAREIFSHLDNVESYPLYDISDGNFPNHHPDPCVEENCEDLKRKVLEVGADLGIGYDGDADRAGFVNELGEFFGIDQFLIVMWKYLYDKVTPKECLFDVKCSKSLEDELIKLGVKPIEYRTGASCTQAASYEGGYPLSGELSGHVYFRDKWPGYDDGIYIGMRLIEMLSHVSKPLSFYLNDISKYYSTPEIKVHVDDDIKFEVVNRMKNYCISKKYNLFTIDGAKVKFDDGFALVRASNTGPNITMRFEAKTQERLDSIQNEFQNALDKIIKKML